MLVVSVLAALADPLAAVLVVAAGPVARGARALRGDAGPDGQPELADAWDGLRLHWRRGLELGALGAPRSPGSPSSRSASTGAPRSGRCAFLTLYVLVLLGIYALVLWTLAIAEPDRGLRSVAREAAVLVASRPGATLVLGLALLLVNVAGIAAAVMPFLTLTVAYTFLAVAHFVLPPPTPEETA